MVEASSSDCSVPERMSHPVWRIYLRMVFTVCVNIVCIRQSSFDGRPCFLRKCMLMYLSFFCFIFGHLTAVRGRMSDNLSNNPHGRPRALSNIRSSQRYTLFSAIYALLSDIRSSRRYTLFSAIYALLGTNYFDPYKPVGDLTLAAECRSLRHFPGAFNPILSACGRPGAFAARNMGASLRCIRKLWWRPQSDRCLLSDNRLPQPAALVKHESQSADY